jgi:predicted MarR family transcription regulator
MKTALKVRSKQCTEVIVVGETIISKSANMKKTNSTSITNVKHLDATRSIKRKSTGLITDTATRVAMAMTEEITMTGEITTAAKTAIEGTLTVGTTTTIGEITTEGIPTQVLQDIRMEVSIEAARDLLTPL